MVVNLFVLQRNCKKETPSRRMIYRFSNNLSSTNNTKSKVIPSYLNKFINHLMVDGKKGIAVEIFAESLRLFSRKLQEGKETPLLIKNQQVVGNLGTSHSEVKEPSKEAKQESYSKIQTFLLDGRYRAPAFVLKPIWCASGVNHCCLAKPSTCSSLMNKYLETWQSQAKKSSASLSEMSSSKTGTRCAPDAHQMGNTFKSALQPYFNSIKYPFFLQRPGANLLGLAFCSPLCSSLLIKDEQFQDRHKVGNDGRIREKTILFGKQYHFRKSNSPSSSLINCLEQALLNVEPSLEVRKKKIAGITRQIPSTLSKSRGQGLAIRWIVESARGRRRKEGRNLSECLAEELVSAYHKKGEPRQKRDALHKLAESNRSFLRYRWW